MWERGIKMLFFYQTTEDEEDHEKAPEGCFCIDVSVAHGGHGDHE